jgi:hypothetical protein
MFMLAVDIGEWRMRVPVLDGLKVMLAEQSSFCSGYMAGVLEQAGAQVLGPFPTSGDVLAWKHTIVAPLDVAVVAVDRFARSHLAIVESLEKRSIPYMLIQDQPTPKPEPGTVLTWPFGGFQVVEAVSEMLARRTNKKTELSLVD